MDIKYLQTNEELLSIHLLIKQHHSTLKDEDFTVFVEEFKQSNYQCLGIYEEGSLVATVGFWVGVRFYCGKYMYVNNFVVDSAKRGKGFGSRIMCWLEEEAVRLGCKAVVLDSYVTNKAAHQFYFGKGYHISNFHFRKDV